MFRFLRRNRAATLATVSFCDSCSQVCTAACRADTHFSAARTRALTTTYGLR
ncbi:hypothetical protein [Actinoplanes xinjiangensis]|uniref:Uncharacterized protein n=1 Tax=Actinoplanes xinjiangensis TaxID=512350 RepID=A0A316F5C7_9ACTN|nr:hypothetical protein [Actinoplanes xinjiangensis]PWK40228.1 hypothetical protein BC793_120167 [Actinoplanes xinjiangensis]GIF42545.1 hypothetical protein Axi01nite_68560 [Actinoplanes xinjiangensis]